MPRQTLLNEKSKVVPLYLKKPENKNEWNKSRNIIKCEYRTAAVAWGHKIKKIKRLGHHILLGVTESNKCRSYSLIRNKDKRNLIPLLSRWGAVWGSESSMHEHHHVGEKGAASETRNSMYFYSTFALKDGWRNGQNVLPHVLAHVLGGFLCQWT